MAIKVAIIEDNEFLRSGLVELISTQDDFECVFSLDSCSKLQEMIGQKMPDVIVMDIDLPGMTGIDGVKLIRQHHPNVQVMMFTVFDDDERIFDSIMAGASGYLLKKSSPFRVLDALREVMAGGAPMTASIAARVLKMFKHEKEAKTANNFDLTPRELEIVETLVKGYSYKLIADKLFISIDTVRSHIRNIYEKLHVHSKSEVVAKALSSRLFRH